MCVRPLSSALSLSHGLVSAYEGSQSQNGSHSDQPLSTSLPSSETKGAQPFEHVGGVGSLPGTLSESSVALLPDERAARTPVSKDEPQTQGNNQAKVAAFSVGGAGKTEVSANLPPPFFVHFFVRLVAANDAQ